LKHVKKALANFFASGVSRLGHKLGPLLWQFPTNFRFDAERLQSFFELLPRDRCAAAQLARQHDERVSRRSWMGVEDEKQAISVEVRHSSFATPDFVRLLRAQCCPGLRGRSDRPGQLIAWRSINCPYFESAGSIRFDKAPQNRGTTLRLILQYIPPGGAPSAMVSKVFGKDPEPAVENDLRRLKQLLEAGEIATTRGQPSGAYPRASHIESDDMEGIGFRPPQRTSEQKGAASAMAS
jgi:Protein of unknown function DUF72